MQSTRTSSALGRLTRQELRPAIAMIGILATGIVTALVLPVWMAAIAVLIAYTAIRVIAQSDQPALEPAVIRRERRH